MMDVNERLKKYYYLMPYQGMASTKAGEIIRAINRILYRFYNDGDVFCYGYGKETCGCAATYLMHHVDGIEKDLCEIESDCFGMGDCLLTSGIKRNYINKINVLINNILDYIDAHPELLTEINDKDMFDENGFIWGWDEETDEY